MDGEALRERVSARPWPDEAQQVGNQAGRVADLAFLAAEELGAKGRWREAKEAALTGAIATDKAQLLTGGATSRSEGRHLVANVSADRVASLLSALGTGKGLGIPREIASDQGKRELGVSSEGVSEGDEPGD